MLSRILRPQTVPERETVLYPQVEISAQNLKVSYGRTVALDLPFLQARGRILAIIGHNGSGKSTFLKTTLGLLPPKHGSLAVDRIADGGRVRLAAEQHMAFSPETGAVFGDVSVESYIKLWCRLKQGNSNYYRKEGAHYLERLDIVSLLPKLGRELSKGQRRRVQSCVGFLACPEFFLFDEPFDGLDIAQSNQLSSLMGEESRNMAMLISSHRMEVVERIADSVIVLDSGKVIASGTVDDVCSVLCQQSLVLTQVGDFAHRIVAMLREHFPSCVVHAIGAQVSLTGPTIDSAELLALLAQYELPNGVHLREVKPSLVDAMHYHLQRGLETASHTAATPVLASPL